MTLTIKHAKVNNIPDPTQADVDAQIALGNLPAGTVLADLTLHSDWNAAHVFTGTLEQDQNNVAVDGVTVTGNGTSGNPLVAVGGSGDVTGPASATDNAIVRYDGATGKLIQNSAATIADTSGNVTAGTYNGNTIGVGSTSGTNTGDQTSIAGITGTKAQFDTAVTDGNFLYVGDVTQYTDEMAQDAVGAMVNTSLTYTDGGPALGLTSRTINGTAFDGTGNITITAAAGTLTGATLAAGVTASSLTSVGTIATGVWQGTAVADAYIASAATWNAKQSAITFGTGVQTALGVNIGSAGAPVLFNGALGTPSSGVATNLTGTAAGLTAGTVTTNANLTGDVTSVGNATTLTNAPVIAKVLTGYTSGAGTVSATDSILQAIQKLNGNDATNANLTGPITSVGNATSIASQTGTGTKFVVDTSPTLVTPLLGTPTSGVLTNCTGAPTFTSLAFSSTTGLVGTATNNDAAAGSVGEYVSSTIAAGSPVALTASATATNITSISLTAGDWDVWGVILYNGNAATTVGYAESTVTSTSATRSQATSNTMYAGNSAYFASINGAGFTVAAPMQRISISGTTTVYLVAYASYAVNTMNGAGFIAARRRR